VEKNREKEREERGRGERAPDKIKHTIYFNESLNGALMKKKEEGFLFGREKRYQEQSKGGERGEEKRLKGPISKEAVMWDRTLQEP